MGKTILAIFGSLAGLILILLARACGSIVGKEAGNALTTPAKPTTEQIVAKLTEVANQLNQKTPMMPDEYTRLDYASVGPGLLVTYHYTLLKESSRDVDNQYLQRDFSPGVREKVCSDKAMAPSLKYGVAYSYAYTGSDGVKIGEIKISKDDCGTTPAPTVRSAAAPNYESKGWTEESTNSTEVGPWLQYDPPGTRYWRDYKNIIYRVYPPGVKPSAAPANPFGLNGSTESVPPPYATTK